MLLGHLPPEVTMKTKLKYLGVKEKLVLKFPHFKGPYDFSTGSCDVDAKDAEVLLKTCPRSFAVVAVVAEEKKETKVPGDSKTVPPAVTTGMGVPSDPK